jgi:hypothetical protein
MNEVFLEHSWFVAKPIIINKTLYSIVFISKKHNGAGYLIGKSRDELFTYHSKKSIWMQFNERELKDTLTFQVFNTADTSSIGKLKLVKKL